MMVLLISILIHTMVMSIRILSHTTTNNLLIFVTVVYLINKSLFLRDAFLTVLWYVTSFFFLVNFQEKQKHICFFFTVPYSLHLFHALF